MLSALFILFGIVLVAWTVPKLASAEMRWLWAYGLLCFTGLACIVLTAMLIAQRLNLYGA